MSEAIHARERVAAHERCAYCHEEFVALGDDGAIDDRAIDDRVTCVDCRTPHHAECFAENKRCASLGCGSDHVDVDGDAVSTQEIKRILGENPDVTLGSHLLAVAAGVGSLAFFVWVMGAAFLAVPIGLIATIAGVIGQNLRGGDKAGSATRAQGPASRVWPSMAVIGGVAAGVALTIYAVETHCFPLSGPLLILVSFGLGIRALLHRPPTPEELAEQPVPFAPARAPLDAVEATRILNATANRYTTTPLHEPTGPSGECPTCAETLEAVATLRYCYHCGVFLR